MSVKTHSIAAQVVESDILPRNENAYLYIERMI